jgi:hypothetical protein
MMTGTERFRCGRPQKEFAREAFPLIPDYDEIGMMGLGIAVNLEVRSPDGNVMLYPYAFRCQYFRPVLQCHLCPIVESLFGFQRRFGYQTLEYFKRQRGKGMQQIQLGCMLRRKLRGALHRSFAAWGEIGGDEYALNLQISIL